ncbi:UNVERIFIED_ORG: cell division protein ZapA (FtsZ GTPase activity inhibitor) [Pseudomonas parafulva]|jgi:cell division protein ZapA|uniref:Cell division protein ZapA n=1 Tax=Pseudomonas fulva TaxID=47880 RepID=A0A2L1WIF6_9PSED|nr:MULTISPECIES: cell division protein ZapA [Pseudomonas]MDP9554517.1 cell division protein ZapA (FtsZ GTPase activity inhibitor) [Pseudomonas parafulva]MDP9662414.1 cell division protein ZapA (FtsZ GTPase activity inhibitor) [Pseudomonas cremoricolorata]HCL54684.1 cell division protein ZapA [Pseudomonas sp.]AVF57269.1 cell division protein ZapA [Pseudomonas fulva]MBA1205567.1 cell division protein ZapA [Pseudomonas fulva]
MSLQAQPVNVVSILGNDYSIKAPEGQEETLAHAVRMLNTALAETKRSYPTLIGDKLLVLAALNLCSKQVELQKEHQRTLARTQAQIDATVDAIVRTIAEQ